MIKQKQKSKKKKNKQSQILAAYKQYVESLENHVLMLEINAAYQEFLDLEPTVH